MHIIILVLSFILEPFLYSPNPADIEAKIEALRQEYGIKIIYKDGFPPLTERMSTKSLCEFYPILSKELKKYPKEIFGRDLDEISLVKYYTTPNGVPFGGTYYKKAILVVFHYYVINSSENKLIEKQFVAGNIHHEISSVFMSYYEFPKDNWVSINPKDFSYWTYDASLKLLKEKKDMFIGTEENYKKGILNDYGRTYYENDFNEYARMAFTEPEKLKQLEKKYPRIRKKAALLRKFYRSISKDFYPAYFGEEANQ